MSEGRPHRSPLPNRPWRQVRRIPSSHYVDEAHLERERTEVFKRTWLVACLEWQVERPGDYAVFDELGESILVVRDDRGTVRAMHNSCRHRGSRLMEGCGRSSSIDCPYHGWSYGLDGSLQRVPREEGFEKLSINKMALKPVRCATWGGFVWVNLDPEAPPLLESLGTLPEELAPYRLEEMRPIGTRDEHIPANWKAMLENAMDFYHVPFVHGRTISRHVSEGPDLHSYGDHSRQRLAIASYGWRQRLDRACTRGGPYSETQASSLHKYLIFPNLLINVLPYHLTVMQAWPVDAQTCRLRYSFNKRKGARGIELARVYATGAASRYILKEDIDVLLRFQRGIATGRVAEQHLHDEEAAASHFHGALERWMAQPAT